MDVECYIYLNNYLNQWRDPKLIYEKNVGKFLLNPFIDYPI